MQEDPKIGLLIMSALFRGDEITSHTHEFDPEFYKPLPHLYCILVADRPAGPSRFVAGMIIKTSRSHHDEHEFREAVMGLLAMSPPLSKVAGKALSFVPGRVTMADPEPVTEEECLRILAMQLYKHKPPAGNA